MLNAGYHAVPPGMIATVVTSLEMLELPTLRPEAPDPNWRLDAMAVYAGRGRRSGRRLPCRPGRRDTCSQAGRKPVWTDDLSSPVSPLFKAAVRDRRRAGKVTNLLTASQNHVPEHDGVIVRLITG